MKQIVEEIARLKIENADLTYELLAAKKNRDEWKQAFMGLKRQAYQQLKEGR